MLGDATSVGTPYEVVKRAVYGRARAKKESTVTKCSAKNGFTEKFQGIGGWHMSLHANVVAAVTLISLH